jgi:hypothetical protein
MKRLAALYGGSAQHHRSLHEPKYHQYFAEIIYLRDLAAHDLTAFDGLLIPERLHAPTMRAVAPHIMDMLIRGGTVIAFGEQPDPWLPGICWEYRPTNFWWWRDPSARSRRVAVNPAHPFFRAVPLEAATWHQHGVFLPPEGAETVIATEDGAAVLYIDRVTTPGTLRVTSLDPMWHFASYFMPATERFLDKFLPWSVEELL